MKKLWKFFKIAWFTLVTIFFIWNWTTFQSRNLPENTLSSDNNVEVIQTDDQIIFLPKELSETLEVIFFQGGLVDPKAYAPLCRKIAGRGYKCHLMKMSIRLPQFGYKKISKLFDLKSSQYVIGGHSQGGKMAAQFVYENPELMKGLFLLGTSHPRDIDLSDLSIPAIKLYAENDGLASVSEVLENKNKLPEHTDLIFIKGGNHSQFGYLGKLLMDDLADISLKEQQFQTFENLVKFFEETKNDL